MTPQYFEKAFEVITEVLKSSYKKYTWNVKDLLPYFHNGFSSGINWPDSDNWEPGGPYVSREPLPRTDRYEEKLKIHHQDIINNETYKLAWKAGQEVKKSAKRINPKSFVDANRLHHLDKGTETF